MPEMQRAATLDDAFEFASAGMLTWDIPQQLALYVPRIPIREYTSIDSSIDVLERMLNMNEIDPYFIQMRDFLSIHFVDRYKANNMTMPVNILHTEKESLGQFALFACLTLPDADCVKDAQMLFSTWMNEPAVNPIDVNYRGTVYCTAVANGGQAEYDFVSARFAESYDPFERDYLRQGMSCSPDTRKIQSILDNHLLKGDLGRAHKILEQIVRFNKPNGKALAEKWFLGKGGSELKSKNPKVYRKCERVMRLYS